MSENDPIFNALAGGGNPTSFYAAGQNPQIFMQQPENEQSVPQTVPPVVNANNDNDAVVDDNSADQSGASVGTALNGSEGAGEPPTITIPQRTMTAELPKVTKYQDLIEELTPYRTLSPKEIQELRKKQKREAIFAAIGDGIAAISNLYFAGKSGFSNFDGKNALSTVSQKRWEKLWDDYKENQEKMLSFKLRAMGMDDTAAQSQWAREKAVEDAAITDAVRERAYTDQRKDRADDVAYRDMVHTESREDRVADVEYRERAHADSVRLQNASINATRTSRTASQSKPMKLVYGRGENDFVNINTPDVVANIPFWFEMLPESVRNNVHGKERKHRDLTGEEVIDGYDDPSEEQMLVAIKRYLAQQSGLDRNHRDENYGLIANQLRVTAGLDEDFSLYKE